MTRWTAENIPDQSGRVALVTGANSGLGFQTALELARHGARVVLACRSAERGSAAVERLRAELPGANVELRLLDLADLDSVRAFAAAFLAEDSALDLLVNNAAVMAVPDRHASAQGFELQFATNHLGHFALTGLLLPALRDVAGSRVVTLSSLNHLAGTLHLDDLQLRRGYGPWLAYNQSKFANALFTVELDRRLRAAGAATISVGAHPGYTATVLQFTGPRLGRVTLGAQALAILTRVAGQPEAMGALPTLMAATAQGVVGGEYFGPSGFRETRGYPKRVRYLAASYDPELGATLWDVSEQLAGVVYL